eukprot:SAG31_NODE_25835_length_453_cov_0.813559_1_plen_85_part_10
MAACWRRICCCSCCLVVAAILWCAGAFLTVVLQDGYEAELDACIRRSTKTVTPGGSSTASFECDGVTELFAAVWAGQRPPVSALV